MLIDGDDGDNDVVASVYSDTIDFDEADVLG